MNPPNWNTSLVAANKSPRRLPVQCIVLHDTWGSGTHNDTLYLAREQTDGRSVSCDFTVEKDGSIWKLNPDLQKWATWHAGYRTQWERLRSSDVNHGSIGIELCQSSRKVEYTAAQLGALLELVAWLCWHFKLSPKTAITTHAKVSLAGKTDPRKFDLAKFVIAVQARLSFVPVGRKDVAQAIVDFEARRDSHGRVKVYRLPASDRGGTYEVAGINNKYHPAKAAELAAMVESGRQAEAEAAAVEYVASYTDLVREWHPNPGIQAFLRDCVFNRGATGAAKILQLAVGADPDGVIGPKTRAAVAKVVDPAKLLSDLRHARERYEREYVGVRPDLWAGLVNRWDKARLMAERYL